MALLLVQRDQLVGCFVPRIEPTHVVVTGHATVHDCRISLLCNRFCSLSVVYPIWETPHCFINPPKFNSSTGVVLNRVLKLFAEMSVIKKYVRVVVPPVEVTFDRLKRLNNSLKFLVPSQHNKCCVCSGRICLGF